MLLVLKSLIETVLLRTGNIGFKPVMRFWYLSHTRAANVQILSSKCLDSVLFRDQKPKMGTLANSEDPDEMPQYAAFHLGLYCLLGLNLWRIKYNIF